MKPVVAKGHHTYVRGKEIYDGRVTFPTDSVPETITIDGHTYRLDDKPVGYVNPEMHRQRETR